VSVAPGARTLTRIFRSLRSRIQWRAKLRIAALGRAIDAERWQRLDRAGRPGEDDRRAVAQQWQCLLHREQRSFHIEAKGAVELFLGDRAEPLKRSAASIGDKNVDRRAMLLDDIIKTIEVGKAGDVALHTDGARSPTASPVAASRCWTTCQLSVRQARTAK